MIGNGALFGGTAMIIDLIIAIVFSVGFAVAMFILWCYLCQVYEEKLLEESESDGAD